ncbi:MAG: carboxypeptidase-like regulatory domain-containing protein, partial [Singulisphaera sp.]
MIVTGRLVDTSTGRPVRAKHVTYTKVPGNPNEGDGNLSTSGLVDPTFRITVPAGEGMLYANVRGVDHPYTRARLRPADKGKGIGGIGDGEPRMIRLDAYHSYRMINIPADLESFHAELELTRGDSRKGKLVGPDGNPVVGAQCVGQSDAWADAKTLADETFEVFGLSAGHPRLLVFGHEKRRLVGWIMIRDGDLESDVPLSVRLERAGSIKGRLVDEDGLPLAGATFSVQPHYPDGQNLASSRQGLWPDEVTSTSDAEGRFQVVGLKPGLKSSIHVQSERLPAMRLDSGEILRNLTVQPGET